MTLQEFLSLLENVTGSGKQYSAKCPAHDDQRASLSISTGENGKILLNCHAGCTPQDIAAAVGLTMKDLFEKPRAEQDFQPREKPHLVATYKYIDPEGRTSEKQRYSDKSFRWRRSDGNGDWIYDRKGITPTLYGTETGLLPDRVYFVEGEKDADNLRKHRVAAVSPPDGAQSKWKPQFTESLKGKHVVILPDNDRPGRELARKAAVELHGQAASVKVLDLAQEWPQLSEKGDISDILDMMPAEDVFTKLEALEAITPEWEPGDVFGRRKEKGPEEPALVCLEGVHATETKWLWHPYIPMGKITLLEADPGTGKTFLALMLAAVVSSGGRFFGEPDTIRHKPANVIYQTAEDGFSDTIKPRLESMIPQPDFSRTFVINEETKGLTLSDERIENALKQARPKLFIIDPLQAYLGAEVDMHRANEVRPILAKIGRLAEKYECAFLFIMHMSKDSQGAALYRALGSIDIPAVARSMLFLGRDPENPQRRILCHEKSSLALHGESLAFRIAPELGGVVFDGYSELSADDILHAKSKTRNKPAMTLTAAIQQLGELLGEEGAATLEQVETFQTAAGISRATLYRAKSELALQTLTIGKKPNHVTWWLDPDVDKEQFKFDHAPPLEQIKLETVVPERSSLI